MKCCCGCAPRAGRGTRSHAVTMPPRGHLRVLQWAHEKCRDFDSARTSQLAAAGGHINMLQWLRKDGFGWSCRVYLEAANAGQLEVV